MMHRSLLLISVVFLSINLFGQLKPKLDNTEKLVPVRPESPLTLKQLRAAVPLAAPSFLNERSFDAIGPLPKRVKGQRKMKAYISPETGTPYAIRGSVETTENLIIIERPIVYFEAIQPLLKIENPEEEFVLTKTSKEEAQDVQHLHFQQVWKGVSVYGAESKLHLKEGKVYLYNGRSFPSPNIENVVPGVSEEAAMSIVMDHVSTITEIKELTGWERQLVALDEAGPALIIYHPDKNATGERLAWHITIVPNLAHRFAYFIDAQTGEILNTYPELCQLTGHLKAGNLHHFHENNSPNLKNNYENKKAGMLDGPATANAIDLCGISRLINTYEVGFNYFLVDASRPMFNFAQSDIPGEPVGAVWTIDAQNTSPENNNFGVANVGSSNNTWNNPIAVSAHYHGGLAYEYFKNTFNRESINGQGGNIVSIINVVESNGQQMDNAFWNGAAMFYGNGNQAFDEPLSKSPDVAGHEMSHGVVQSTANLEYFGESGALNESFADVFGAMIDRDDWKIGEDIVDNSIFPTGALRDMQNPNNGGNSLNDNGYQPDHYDDKFTGSGDNGGVHINSGIPNKAFQLFADAIGKDKAELVYYRALTEYLFRSAQFVDCRIAVEQAAADLYGTVEVNAVQNAFSAVGIGMGSGTNSQTNASFNPGEDFILMTDNNYSDLYIFRPDGTSVSDPLTNISPFSRPSVTDDGSAIVYIADDNTMQVIFIDWQASSASQETLDDDPIWRNVAVSKQGTHLAALTIDNDNLLWIYDFGLEDWQSFELFNPTTGEGGPTTGDVLYADVLEWDFTGEWVMYDALNRINSTSGADIEYWDISFAKVWENGANNFGDGLTSKLFNGLPEDISIGNPTFSKNSDYIIAFDYIDEFEETYFLVATNLETGDVGTVFQNVGLSWPNYAMDDTRLVFDAEDDLGTPVLAFAPLASDKINPDGYASIYLNNKRGGVWFANGERMLVDAEELFAEGDINVFPNPVKNKLSMQWMAEKSGPASVHLLDVFGKKIKSFEFEMFAGKMEKSLDLGSLPSGNYFVRLLIAGSSKTFKVVKL